MNEPEHSDRLLNDVLEDGTSPEFRASVLERTLREVRRHRRVRKARRGALIAASLLSVSIAIWRSVGPNSLIRPGAACELVPTQPLPAAQVVETKDGAAKVIMTAASNAPIEFGTLPEGGRFTEFNDSDLLNLLAGKPVALVRLAPHQAEIVFLNPDDAEGFSIH
jgi:hypothetical protein